MADSNRSGIVAGLVAGIGAIILVTIVVFLIVDTVESSKLLRETATITNVVNESGWINSTPYTVTNWDGSNRNFAIVEIKNTSGINLITSGNYTFDSVNGTLHNATGNWRSVKITYTYIAPTSYEKSTTGMANNLSAGINNVSNKIPTVLLMGAVVLLFGVLVLLIRQAQSMGMGSNQGSL